MRTLWLIATVPLLAVSGCGGEKGHPDQRTKDILAGATKVEVFRIDGKNSPWEYRYQEVPGERRIGGYLVLAQGQDRGPEFAAKLGEILADEKTHSDIAGACFWPGVVYRVWKGEEVADVVVCYMCKGIYYGPPTDRALAVTSFLGSPREPDLVRLAKEAFPQDKDIQGLSEEVWDPRKAETGR